MRRTLTLVLAVVLLAAACTSGDDTDTATDDAVTATTAAEEPSADEQPAEEPSDDDSEAPAPTGPAPGVTDTEIHIGITYPDLGAVESVAFNHGDYEGAYQALIDDINANGGINGRMLVPHYAPVNPSETASAEENCVLLTQDVGVFAVLGFFLGDAVLCYIEVNETAAIGSPMTDELLDRANAPWFSNDPSSEDSTIDGIRAFVEEGLLDGNVGIFAADDQEAFVDATAVPLLADEGIETTVAIGTEVTDEFESIQQTAPILERFAADGIDTVVLVGTGASSRWLSAAETTDYRPQLLSTDIGTMTSWAADEEAGHDLSVLEGSIASGGFGPPEAQFLEPDQQACVAIIDAHRDEPTINPAEWVEGEPRSWVSANAACGSVTLFAAIAEAAGDDLNYGTFQQAGENLGELKLPGNPEPYFFGPRPSLDGDSPVFLFEWVPDAREFLIPDGA